MRTKIKSHRRRKNNRCFNAPHLIKPPWKKQKDKTYSIRMTCGSILWLEISPHARWITCRLIVGISKSTEKLVRPEWREKASSLSLSLSDPNWSLGKLLSPPTKSEGGCRHANSKLSASGGWSALVRLSVRWCLCSRGVSACVRVWFFPPTWQCGSSPFHSVSLPRSKKFFWNEWRFKGTVAFVLMAASGVIILN